MMSTRKILGAVALVATLLASLPLSPVHAGTQPNLPKATHLKATFSHQGLTPASSWSCTMVVNGWRAGSLVVLAGQGYVSCTQPMKYLNLRLYADVCTLYWLGACWGPQNFGQMGYTCFFNGMSGGWCPPSGGFTRSVNTGSTWVVEADSEATAYDGSGGGGQDFSNPVSF